MRKRKRTFFANYFLGGGGALIFRIEICLVFNEGKMRKCHSPLDDVMLISSGDSSNEFCVHCFVFTWNYGEKKQAKKLVTFHKRVNETCNGLATSRFQDPFCVFCFFFHIQQSK